MQIESTDGVTLAVHDLGGNGPPLLWCHATGFCAAVWKPLVAHIPNRHSWALDFRGHGGSTPPADLDFSWYGMGRDVLAVVDELGLSGIPAVGHSKGAASLLLAEAARPGTFERIWAFEPVVFPAETAAGHQKSSTIAEGARRRRNDFPNRATARERFASRPPFSILDAKVLDAYVEHGFIDTPDGGVTLSLPGDHEARIYDNGRKHRAFDVLHRVRCPVVIARGGLDGDGPAQVAHLIVNALPNGRLAAYDDLTHFGPLEQPARLAADIAAFLDEAGANQARHPR
ncbi:MAG: alpha/beta hydrolase [Actinomycetia bacterium]|nr:alpha/beta hydrolase [Actinomycetes bacterium]